MGPVQITVISLDCPFNYIYISAVSPWIVPLIMFTFLYRENPSGPVQITIISLDCPFNNIYISAVSPWIVPLIIFIFLYRENPTGPVQITIISLDPIQGSHYIDLYTECSYYFTVDIYGKIEHISLKNSAIIHKLIFTNIFTLHIVVLDP